MSKFNGKAKTTANANSGNVGSNGGNGGSGSNGSNGSNIGSSGSSGSNIGSSGGQLSGFGRPTKDLGVSIFSTEHMTSHVISSIHHVDQNVLELERDIYDLQDIAFRSAEESINTMQEIATLQNDLVETNYVQSLPWFCKTNVNYKSILPTDWNTPIIPDSGSQMFVRFIDLEDTFTGMILILPRVQTIGEARHVSIHPRSNEACVYITTNPADSIRLSSFDIEWFPGSSGSGSPGSSGSSDNSVLTDRLIGHGTLLAKPNKLNGYLFGSAAESSCVNGQCVVFGNSGAFYIQSIHIDNNSGHSKIVMVGQKFQSTSNKTLGGFSFYALN